MRQLWITLVLVFPVDGWAWGNDGHWLILETALGALPPEVRRIFAGQEKLLRRYTVEPDKHSTVPAEGCKHYLNIEKLDRRYLAALQTALKRTYGQTGFADEDARGVAARIERRLFTRSPPPWSAEEVQPLWKQLPPTLPAFRTRYKQMEIFIGTVVYQPLLYTQALSRAIANGSQRWTFRYAGYLAHYVGDLHVPLHVTTNYKGQYSGNPVIASSRRSSRTDVHARFEIGLIRSHLDFLRREIAKACRDARPIAPQDITPRAIAAAQEAYSLAEIVLETDRRAASQADPRRAWPRYLRAASSTLKPLAARQLAAASIMLADLLLTASQGNLLATLPGSSNMEAR